MCRRLRRHVWSVSREAHHPVILLGGQSIAVCVGRSVGRAGVSVTALGDGRFDSVGASRYCTTFVDLGSGHGVQERWLDWLRARPRSEAVIFPCNDDGIELVARNRPLLVASGYLPAELNDEVALATLDKQRAYELAREAGVATPRTMVTRTPEDAQHAADELGYPCALKPLHSHLFARHFGLTRKLLLADTRDEVGRIVRETQALGLEMLLTEIIPGPDDLLGSYWTYRTADGSFLFDFTKRKLRQYPTHFGLGTYHVTDRNPAIVEAGRRFCTGLDVQGIAIVEFKLDSRDGLPKLIECNQRFTLAIELLRHAGIDLAWLAYQRVVEVDPGRIEGYRTGVRLWFPKEDMRAFASYRSRGELTAGSWLASLLHRQHFSLFSPTDPLPSIVSGRRFLGRVFARLPGARGRSSRAATAGEK